MSYSSANLKWKRIEDHKVESRKSQSKPLLLSLLKTWSGTLHGRPRTGCPRYNEEVGRTLNIEVEEKEEAASSISSTFKIQHSKSCYSYTDDIEAHDKSRRTPLNLLTPPHLSQAQLDHLVAGKLRQSKGNAIAGFLDRDLAALRHEFRGFHRQLQRHFDIMQ